MTGSDSSHDYSPDQRAAHEFLVELDTRIATRRLPYQHGVEKRALESLRELFSSARETMKKYPGCIRFCDAVNRVLNIEIRPLTAKWHRAAEVGRLGSRDGSDEFRGDLEALRPKLCALARELRVMAYGDDVQSSPLDPNEPDNFEKRLASDLERDFSALAFGIVKRRRVADAKIDEKVDAINRSEAAEITSRRQKYAIETPDGQNAVGLALSGGGIRSATFCLGVVQVLAERNLLKSVDFLSTVSGGGYVGSFITSRIGTGASFSDIAAPHGPDTEPVAFLRQHAKYLAAVNLKQRWSMVTATIAGLVLNWSTPFFLLALLACIAVPFADHFQYDWWRYVFLGLVGVSAIALGFYAIGMRLGRGFASVTGVFLGVSAALTLACAAFWGLHALFPHFFEAFLEVATGEWSWSTIWIGGTTISIATIAGAVPVVTRVLPWFEKPKFRELVLKVALWVAGLLIPICAVIVFFLFCSLGVVDAECVPGWPLPRGYALYILVATLGFIAALLNVNMTAPHRLYRDQLAKTFVSRHEGDETPVALESINSHAAAPYHLLNATVNLPSSESAALRDRKCDFFLFSKHWCGSPATGYGPTSLWLMSKDPADLASAMAISGAAIAPRMGLGSIPALTALLTFLNVRLGFWIKNPGQKSMFKIPGFILLLREMFGLRMSEHRAWLHLSDGGHIENMGVYELLRRRCKFIICVDGEADPKIAFPGFMTLVRHAQIDFGVQIDASLDELRPNPATGYSRAHAALFRVRYPEEPPAPDSVGLLLYLKLSVTGNEPELIKRYRSVHGDFPHQSTLDQFFDQEQFEAYRQLGVHVAESLFAQALLGENASQGSIPEWFQALARNLLEPDRSATDEAALNS